MTADTTSIASLPVPQVSRDGARVATLRICMVVEAAGAGVGRHALDLSEELSLAGHDVHMVYSPLRAERAFMTRLGTGKYKKYAIPIRRNIGWRDATAALMLRRYLSENGPFDIVHGHSSKGGAVARLAAIATGAKTAYTPNAFFGMNPTATPLKRYVLNKMESWLGKLTDALICVSPEEMEFAKGASIAPLKLHLIPNGIDEIQFPSRAQVRSRLGLSEADLVIGFVGRLSQQKAPDVLLQAFGILCNKASQAKLVMVGDGELGKSLKEMSEALGVSDSILWLGGCDARQIFPAFDVFVLPSRYEGLPYVALEALSAGLPIVSTQLAGCRMLVKEGVNGFIVDVNEPAPLAARIEELLQDSAKRMNFGRSSNAMVKQFSKNAMIEATHDVYRLTLRSSRARSART